MYTNTYMCTQIYIYMYVCMYVCMYGVYRGCTGISRVQAVGSPGIPHIMVAFWVGLGLWFWVGFKSLGCALTLGMYCHFCFFALGGIVYKSFFFEER